jgi:hypothetical protein
VRAIFLNRFYWPDEPATAQLLTDLAEALAARGQDVVVITSHPGSANVPAFETRRGVHIARIRGTRWARRLGLLGKAADFGTFFAGALLRLFFTVRARDAIVALTDPPLLGVGVALVARLRGARLFHWVQDIYPELAIELAGQRWLAAFRPFRNLAWRRAERCVTLGTDMAAVLASAGVPSTQISIVANWAPAGTAPPPTHSADDLRTAWGLLGKFVVAYSGNLGRVHDLAPVLNVAAALRTDDRIAFVFIGDGAQREPLAAAARRLGLANLQFHPPQPRDRLSATLALADVHLVTLRPGCERYVFPSKLAGIAAIGRPVIFIGPPASELARLVAAPGAEFGRAFGRDETTAIAAGIRKLSVDPAACATLSAGALRYAQITGGSAAAATRWLVWLSGCGLAAFAGKSINSRRQ